MADPQRDPRYTDPVDTLPPAGVDPLLTPRPTAANTQSERIDRTVIQERRGGSGVLIAAAIVALAIVAYFLFAPGNETATVPADQPPATAEPAAPAPDAMAPAAPDASAPAAVEPDAAAPAPEGSAPDAIAPDASAPAAPAPDATAPAPDAAPATEPAQ